MALFIGGGVLAFLLVCCGGLAVVSSLSGNPSKGDASGRDTASKELPADNAKPETSTPPTTPPRVSTLAETVAIPFQSTTIEDSSLPEGTTKIRVTGVPGVKTLVYELTIVDGIQTDKKLLREEVTKQPVAEVVAIGTKVAAAPRCDPNYAGACVPIASDVDCAGGTGDGPAYVKGPVRVVGTDIYHLDGNDDDGIGRE